MQVLVVVRIALQVNIVVVQGGVAVRIVRQANIAQQVLVVVRLALQDNIVMQVLVVVRIALQVNIVVVQGWVAVRIVRQVNIVMQVLVVVRIVLLTITGMERVAYLVKMEEALRLTLKQEVAVVRPVGKEPIATH